MMKWGKRKAHRKTARRASFLPWSQQSIQAGNQGSHGRKSQLRSLIDSDSSDDDNDMDFQSDSTQSALEQDTEISEKRKSRASSVLEATLSIREGTKIND